MQSQPAHSTLAQTQLQEEPQNPHQFKRFTFLLQIFDEINLSKHLQFRAMSMINYFLQSHPHLISEGLLPQFTFTCIKLILEKFPLQNTVIDQELQFILDQVPEDYYQFVEQMFGLAQVGMPQNDKTPYSLLDDIKNLSMMSTKTYDQIKLVLGYTLTFLETYKCSAEDVLSACILMYSTNHSEALVLLDYLQESAPENTETLKQIFENGLEQDLLLA